MEGIRASIAVASLGCVVILPQVGAPRAAAVVAVQDQSLVLPVAAPAPHARPSRGRVVAAPRGTPQVAVALVHGPCPAYGTVLVPGSQWLSGQGVDVRSNGGVGSNCFSIEPGHTWQCGELVNRFLAARRWSPPISGYAGQFYGNASGAYFDKHPVGSGYLPVPGDVVVWSGGVTGPDAPYGYGHVAVVVADTGGVLTIVQENSSISGYGHLVIDLNGTIGGAGSLVPVGYLHAKANSLQAPKPAPPPAPVPHRQPPPPKPPPAAPPPAPIPAVTSAPPTPTSTPAPTEAPTPTPTATPTSPDTGSPTPSPTTSPTTDP